MTDFPYNRDIPDSPNTPSQDQPLMKTNTNSIADLIAVDHVGFSANNGGIHNKVTMPQVSTPVSSINQLILYSKAASSGTELRMVRDGFPSTDTALTTTGVGSPSRTQNGYSWLPGNILIQWGFATVSPGVNTIVFASQVPCVAFASVGGFAPIVTL